LTYEVTEEEALARGEMSLGFDWDNLTVITAYRPDPERGMEDNITRRRR